MKSITVLLAVYISGTTWAYECDLVDIVYTAIGGGPAPNCTFCPSPTCTNFEVLTLPCTCQGFPFTTETIPTGCQTFGPCNTLSCATEWATWTQPCPTTITTSSSVKPGACGTSWVTQYGPTTAVCALATCTPTPRYCVEEVQVTVDCTCEDVTSTISLPCPTTCASSNTAPAPGCWTTILSHKWTSCTALPGGIATQIPPIIGDPN